MSHHLLSLKANIVQFFVINYSNFKFATGTCFFNSISMFQEISGRFLEYFRSRNCLEASKVIKYMTKLSNVSSRLISLLASANNHVNVNF